MREGITITLDDPPLLTRGLWHSLRLNFETPIFTALFRGFRNFRNRFVLHPLSFRSCSTLLAIFCGASQIRKAHFYWSVPRFSQFLRDKSLLMSSLTPKQKVVEHLFFQRSLKYPSSQNKPTFCRAHIAARQIIINCTASKWFYLCNDRTLHIFTYLYERATLFFGVGASNYLRGRSRAMGNYYLFSFISSVPSHARLFVY